MNDHNFEALKAVVAGYIQVNPDEASVITDEDIEAALKNNRRLDTATISRINNTFYSVNLRDFQFFFGLGGYVAATEPDGEGDYYYSALDKLIIVLNSDIVIPPMVIGYQYLRYNAAVELLNKLLAHYKTAITFSSGVTKIARGEIYDQIMELRDTLLRQCQPTTVKVRVD